MAGVVYIFATPLDVVPTPLGTPSTLTALLFLGLWTLSVISGHPRWPRRSLAIPAMGAIALWYALTMAWSWDQAATGVQVRTFVLLALSAVALGGVFRDRIVAPAWAMSAGSAVASIATLLSGQQIVESSSGLDTQIDQATFLGIDQNILAFHLCLGLAAAAYLLVKPGRVAWRPAAFLLFAVISAALIAVGSRTGAGSMILTFAVMAVVSIRSVRSAVAWAIAFGLAVWGYFQVAHAGLLPERLVLWLKQPSLNDNRLDIIAQYWYSRADWLIRGVGAGSDASYLFQTQGLYRNAHSAFWRIWIDTGLVGLVLWGFMLLALAIRAARGASRLFFLLMAPTIVAFFYTLGPLNSNMLWVVFGLALGAVPKIGQLAAPTKRASSPAQAP